ncbi:biopolymer transporter ExbD [Oscillatoria sp. FACHB-1407]|uniref:ExbD/TolR family protein n=1 Tax=Oscillatoria sp. FACHB-1407 TaxID=2692847 RepID=UPI001689B0C2|nr:biopolymer transporter ExbD [Oscillatoria sp. FACHB-1407]MBD2464508.1 biopolymer transporter ExbD [Oscillatoria sp. FACHB-1407]
MRFNNRQGNKDLPQVNLIPMMDVLMTVLTFFIIVSMTLTGQVVNVFLPEANSSGGEGQGEGEDASMAQLVVGLNAEKQILLSNQVATTDQLVQEMQTYFQENPEGMVTLKADRSLTYRDVADVLKVMRDVGGGRVSLGVESTAN